MTLYIDASLSFGASANMDFDLDGSNTTDPQNIIEISVSWSHESISLILFVFQKAFDSINHQSLLKKLARIGLHQSIFDLLRSYLTGR